MKTYIASDFHIGHPYANYPRILDFFDLVKKDADELILLGDVFDLWVRDIEDIRTRDPMKSCYKALLDTAVDIPTTIVWGNHEYQLAKKLSDPNITITDSFTRNGIYYTHGWRFDAQQRIGYSLYGWIIEIYPVLYQKYFNTPFKIIENESKPSPYYDNIHSIAKKYIEENNLKYLVMGHTHNPKIDGKLIDCGDFIDSLSFVVFENGTPCLKKFMNTHILYTDLSI